jgi:hypothetical protein
MTCLTARVLTEAELAQMALIAAPEIPVYRPVNSAPGVFPRTEDGRVMKCHSRDNH